MLEVYFETAEYFWITTTFYFIAAILVMLILSIHTYNLCSDLCTSKRKSLQHRSQLPPISRKYISTAILTQFTLTIFCVAACIAAYLRWKFMESTCQILSILVAISYTTAKGLMYILFVARLYSVYGSSAYKYNPKLLIFLVIINLLYCLSFIIILPIWTEIDVVHLEFAEYVIFCQPQWPESIVLAIGGYDFIFSILFLVAFNWPLRKISQHRMRSNSYNQRTDNNPSKVNPEQKMIATLINLGTKSKILIWNAILSTLFHMIFIIITDSPTTVTVDIVVNCICICLMTPYYADDMYYNRLCCLCIGCCHDKKVMEHTVPPAATINLQNVNSISHGEQDQEQTDETSAQNSKSIEV